jgi:NAD-dependent dihydropyrimidine dehydrogenase PreA subunit
MAPNRPEGGAMSFVIAEPCVDVHDRGCVDECPVDCIYDGIRKGYIQPDECVDCGACEPVCPVNAIFADTDLPGEWRGYAEIDEEFFGPGVTGLGSPGGAAHVGEILGDHPALASVNGAA